MTGSRTACTSAALTGLAIMLMLGGNGPCAAQPATAPMSIPPALLEPAAAGGAQAQYDLGIALLCGKELARDPAEAARWMTLAAKQGHDGARSVLGWMWQTGTGVRRDDALAAHWLRLAAEGGDTAAQNNLGVLYALGQGVDRDPVQAARWFGEAAAKGASDAARNLEVLRAGPDVDRSTRRVAAAPVAPAAHPALTAANCRPVRRTGPR